MQIRNSIQTTNDLPPDVISAIQTNQKIKAIKLLRQARKMGLKEAKHAVEAYARANPNPVNPMPLKPESNANSIGLAIFVMFFGFILYQIFTR